ncbi:hypothetical protein PR048_004236 [Dryococelus australis]|uniref:Uncharacterized protein n=1 Tax=Dryococelus australis TaxID=614101 RepID=A0ABQ9I4X1_9NEOP|nr:hypothetical protein PR048_004236 [Dryococelus australis]
MRVIEMSMKQRRNERAGETGNLRENPSTNGIVRHDSHMRKSGAIRPGIEPRSPWTQARCGVCFLLHEMECRFETQACPCTRTRACPTDPHLSAGGEGGSQHPGSWTAEVTPTHPMPTYGESPSRLRGHPTPARSLLPSMAGRRWKCAEEEERGKGGGDVTRTVLEPGTEHVQARRRHSPMLRHHDDYPTALAPRLRRTRVATNAGRVTRSLTSGSLANMVKSSRRRTVFGLPTLVDNLTFEDIAMMQQSIEDEQDVELRPEG